MIEVNLSGCSKQNDINESSSTKKSECEEERKSPNLLLQYWQMVADRDQDVTLFHLEEHIQIPNLLRGDRHADTREGSLLSLMDKEESNNDNKNKNNKIDNMFQLLLFIPPHCPQKRDLNTTRKDFGNGVPFFIRHSICQLLSQIQGYSSKHKEPKTSIHIYGSRHTFVHRELYR